MTTWSFIKDETVWCVVRYVAWAERHPVLDAVSVLVLGAGIGISIGWALGW
jgi:hypothetical protein